MKSWQRFSSLTVCALLLGVCTAEVLADGPFGMGFGFAGSGGGTSSDGSMTVTGLIGQPVVAESRESLLTPGPVVRSGFMRTRARTVTSVGDDLPATPLVNRLNAPYPNPFNPATNIRFEMATAGPVRVKIYDTRGQMVRDLLRQEFAAGLHEVLWDGRNDQGSNAPSGMYFVRFEAGETVGTKKMTLLK